MTDLTIREIIAACSGEWTGDSALLDACPENIVVDSRNAGKGSLFLALHGERTDGHKFIPDVLTRGALAVLCEEAGDRGEPRIVVKDVAEAMRAAASCQRRKMEIPFVGITGSVGKTTAKEMIASVLSARFKTFKTPGSMNGQIGIPVSLMGMQREYETAVIEMGISLFGEMTRITKVVQPDIAVFTNIGDAHLEALHDREGVLRAKSEILLGMSTEGVIVCNGDDPLLRRADFQRRKVLFGKEMWNDVRCEELRSEDGLSLDCVIVNSDRRFPVHVPAYGDYMIYSVLAAAAVGMELGLSDEEIARGMTGYETVGHRSRIVHTPRVTMIDDCYNANPTSNRAAILSMQKLPGRKVCILGDMREMGENSHELHREIGRFLAEQNIALVLTQGDEAKFISEAAGTIACHFETKAELMHGLPDLLQKGDCVLVKASHGPNFVDIVEFIEKMDV